MDGLTTMRIWLTLVGLRGGGFNNIPIKEGHEVGRVMGSGAPGVWRKVMVDGYNKNTLCKSMTFPNNTFKVLF